ncbi:TolC family protein [Acinetobacter sp. ANC 4648]|uniref:TolC family protein n=1 Tax=Acinetobacter sp. ANC 4648 TaxID=1977875 RepID=UPI000A358E42
MAQQVLWILKHGVLCIVLINPLTYLQAEQVQNLALKEAIARANAYQAEQGVWQAQQQISTANIKQSQLWINPNLSIQQTGFGSDQEQELSIGLSQTIDIFGERKAQQQLAQIAQSQLDLRQRMYQAQLQLAVKYLWSQLAVFELERDVVREQLQVSQANLDAIQKRYQAGSLAQVDVDRARLSHSENQRLYHQADLQVQVATQQLSNLWGQSDKTLQVGLSASTLWPSSVSQDIQNNFAENLYEKSRQLQVMQAKATVHHLQVQARPNPTVNVGVNRIKSIETSTENAFVVGVSIPLNIFDRQQYAVQIAQVKQSALIHQQEFYIRQNALQVGALLTELQGLEVQFKEVNQSQIPLATQVQRKTLMGFSAGKFAVTDVQQATLQLQDVRLRKVQLLKDAWQRAIEAESLSLGIEPSQIMAKDAIAQLNQNLWQDTQALPVVGGGN